MRRWYRGGITLIGAALALGLLAGCAGGTTSANTKQLCIGTDLPTTGADGARGKPAENGARLAVDQAKLTNGYTLVLKATDDTINGRHNATQGAANINALSSDPCILAVVGPLDDDVAAATIPIAINAGLPLISPLSTTPGLTESANATADGIDFSALRPAGKPNTFFRLTAPDDVQAIAEVRLATAAGERHAYLVDDASTFGITMAAFFSQAFLAQGGVIAGHASLAATTPAALQTVVDSLRASSAPDVIFYAGQSPTGGALRAALTASGLAALPLIGTSGIAGDPAFIQAAGAAAAGTQATLATPDLSALTSEAASQFTTAYAGRFSGQPVAVSALAYDATQVEIAAINAVIISGNTPTRTNVLAQITRTSYAGLIGPISFDANGDNVGSRIVSVYVVQAQAWVYVKQIAL
ncbi:MAG TPA: branched-chain amino acid ABC transporter substrate-binding protein [Ktedonobacterales bacterium]|jgi:branched-chain amino acid transport system substrate-binding protein|nr:branched-chain amino acid ABC transporter substrate-binding protein [Ktedonobacterales bacterium]